MSSSRSNPSGGSREFKKNPGESRIQGDLVVNQLDYDKSENLTVRLHRTMRQYKANKDTYGPGETCLIRIGNESDFVDFSNSYLRFSVSVDANDADFATNSAIALINQCLVRLRSGVEADRARRVNLYQHHNQKYKHSREYLRKLGTLYGYGVIDQGGVGEEIATNPSLEGVGTTEVVYVIPVEMLCGFFKPVNNVLCPPHLCGGAEVELTFESLATAFRSTASDPSTYTVSKVSLLLESCRITDSAQKAINMRASSESGLTYNYMRYYTSEIPADATSLTHHVSLSVAQCQKAWAVIVNSLADVNVNNFASVNNNVLSFYWRIGQSHFPATQLSGSSAAEIEREALHHAYRAWNKLQNPENEPGVSQAEYSTGGYAVIAQPFSRDNMIKSGEAINSSRQLELNMTRSSSATDDQQVLFVEYLAEATAFMDNAIIGT